MRFDELVAFYATDRTPTLAALARTNGLAPEARVYLVTGALLDEGRLEEAVQAGSLLLESGPLPIDLERETWRMVGRAHRQLAQHAAALHAYRTAELLALRASDKEAWYIAMTGYLRALTASGKHDDAEQRYHRAMAILDRDPTLPPRLRAITLWDWAILRERESRHVESAEMMLSAATLPLPLQDLVRLLGDLGVKLRCLGWYQNARDTFETVTRVARAWTTETNAWIELVHTAVDGRDAMGYHRVVAEVRGRLPRTAGSQRIDAHVALGRGERRFGQQSLARQHLAAAARIAMQRDDVVWRDQIFAVIKGREREPRQPEPRLAPIAEQISRLLTSLRIAS